MQKSSNDIFLPSPSSKIEHTLSEKDNNGG